MGAEWVATPAQTSPPGDAPVAHKTRAATAAAAARTAHRHLEEVVGLGPCDLPRAVVALEGGRRTLWSCCWWRRSWMNTLWVMATVAAAVRRRRWRLLQLGDRSAGQKPQRRFSPTEAYRSLVHAQLQPNTEDEGARHQQKKPWSRRTTYACTSPRAAQLLGWRAIERGRASAARHTPERRARDRTVFVCCGKKIIRAMIMRQAPTSRPV